jgi:hypothetical protein
VIRAKGETGFNASLLAITAHPGCRPTASGQEVDCLKNNRFAGTGFAGEDN